MERGDRAVQTARFVLERKDEYENRFVVVTQQVDFGFDWSSCACGRVVGIPAGEIVHQREGE
jgi:hypothetical protein